MNKTELLAYLLETNLNISLDQIVIGMAVAVLLLLFVHLVYRKTYTGVLYSKSFNTTLVIIGFVTTMVMMIIGSNLALSLGMVGALSIIRFRTAVKEPKDLAFLFWVIGIGLACGAGVYSIAILGSLIIAAILVLSSKKVFDEQLYLLVIHAGEAADLAAIEALIGKHARKSNLKMRSLSAGQTDLTYELRIDRQSELVLIQALQSADDVRSASIVSYTGEVAG